MAAELDPLGSSPKLAEVGGRLLHEKGKCCGQGCAVCAEKPVPWNKGKKLRPISARAQADFLSGLADGLTVRLAAEKAGRRTRDASTSSERRTRRSPRRGRRRTSRARRY